MARLCILLLQAYICYVYSTSQCATRGNGVYLLYNFHNSVNRYNESEYYIRSTNLKTNVSEIATSCDFINRNLECLWMEKISNENFFSIPYFIEIIGPKNNVVWNYTFNDGMFDCFPNPITDVRFVQGNVQWKTSSLYDRYHTDIPAHFVITYGPRVVDDAVSPRNCYKWCIYKIQGIKNEEEVCVHISFPKHRRKKCVGGKTKPKLKVSLNLTTVLLVVIGVFLLVIFVMMVIISKKRKTELIERNKESDLVNPRFFHHYATIPEDDTSVTYVTIPDESYVMK